MVDPRIVTTVGLGLDIVGIWLLFKYGAVGGAWIDAPKREHHRLRPKWPRNWTELQQGQDWKDAFHESGQVFVDEAVERNENRARVGSRWGLGLAVTGFGLQALAQWL